MHDTGDCSVSDLAEVFSVSRPTVCRTLARVEATAPEADRLPNLRALPDSRHVFSPGIWWMGSTMHLSGSAVRTLQMYIHMA